MGRKVIYWAVTGLLALSAVFAGVNYLSGSQQAVQAFAHLGYPQQLRVLLGIAKLLGGITLLVPGLLTVKEWAYAGFTFAWIAAAVAHYLAKDGAVAFFPLILLVLLFVSYLTRPASQFALEPPTKQDALRAEGEVAPLNDDEALRSNAD